MSDRDQQDPIDKDNLPAHEPRDEEPPAQFLHGNLAGAHDPITDPASSPESASPVSASADSFAPPPSEDLADEAAFYLPAIPIAPTRDINTPASRVLSSGDALLDFARDPLGHRPSKPALRYSIPDDLDPELFAKQLPSDPNQPVTRPLSASAPADRLTQSLRPEASASDDVLTSDQPAVPDFPITAIAPFAAGAPSPSHLGTWESKNADSPGAPPFPMPSAERVGIEEPHSPIAPPDFRLEPEPESRIPNFAHIIILIVIATLGFLAAGIAVQFAFRFHLWGVKTIEQATTDVHYTLASMAVLYAVSFAVAFFLFPYLWHKSFFAGLQWNAAAALRRFWLLFAAAGFCFVLAMVDELILPGPTNAPIDKLFSNTAAAWLLFGFGVAVAPLFEEITFRGFLLPALCTAVDWITEYIETEHQWSRPALVFGSAVASSALAAFSEQKFGHHRIVEWFLVSCFVAVVFGLAITWLYQRYHTLGAGSRVRPLGPNGHPQWSLAAMIIGSLLTSLPFAAMHADQIAHSIGPLVLLYCVSLILCFARLATRSLAASTLVHASYNFLLFFLMMVGTGGFKHLDKM